jgi:hypothetical protein
MIGITTTCFNKLCDFKEVISVIKLFGMASLNNPIQQNNLIKDNLGASKNVVDNPIETKIKELFLQKYNIVIDENLKMAQYLYEAVLISYNWKGSKIFIMKKIYKEIAEKYGGNAHNIEVCLQNLIKENIDETYSVKAFILDFLKLL